MRGILLGSGAAEEVPSLWCRCERCEERRRLGGLNLRRTTALLLEPDVLIDLPPGAPEHLRNVERDLAQVAWVVITHAHADHLYLPHLRRRRSDGHDASPCRQKPPMLEVVASPAVTARIRDTLGDEAEAFYSIRLTPVEPGETVPVGSYRFTALRANHEVEGDTPYNYVIQPGPGGAPQETGWFYGCDTGPIPPESWKILERFRFSLLILEATGGDGDPADFPHHLTLQGGRDAVKGFSARGLLAEGCRVVLAHLDSHHWPPHQEATRLVASDGWEVGYDGMRLEG